jgi:hypothetical protein
MRSCAYTFVLDVYQEMTDRYYYHSAWENNLNVEKFFLIFKFFWFFLFLIKTFLILILILKKNYVIKNYVIKLKIKIY